MSHDTAELKATLEQLSQQLADAEELAPAVRQRLEQALADVRAALDTQSTAADEAAEEEEEESLIEQLSETARHIEESHPTLFGTLGSVIDALSRMGI